MPPGLEKKEIGHNSAPSGSQETKKKFDILIFDEDGRMKNLQALGGQESRKPTFPKNLEIFKNLKVMNKFLEQNKMKIFYEMTEIINMEDRKNIK